MATRPIDSRCSITPPIPASDFQSAKKVPTSAEWDGQSCVEPSQTTNTTVGSLQRAAVRNVLADNAVDRSNEALLKKLSALTAAAEAEGAENEAAQAKLTQAQTEATQKHAAGHLSQYKEQVAASDALRRDGPRNGRSRSERRRSAQVVISARSMRAPITRSTIAPRDG